MFGIDTLLLNPLATDLKMSGIPPCAREMTPRPGMMFCMALLPGAALPTALPGRGGGTHLLLY